MLQADSLLTVNEKGGALVTEVPGANTTTLSDPSILVGGGLEK